MTVLLLQPSPTEKLLKRSKFSAVLWIRYRRRLESGGKRRTFDSCFCSRKRSSSSWMRCTKSFSAEERKTPSKQRRARVTGGRACGATETAAIRAQTPGPPTSKVEISPLSSEELGSEAGEGRAQGPGEGQQPVGGGVSRPPLRPRPAASGLLHGHDGPSPAPKQEARGERQASR